MNIGLILMRHIRVSLRETKDGSLLLSREEHLSIMALKYSKMSCSEENDLIETTTVSTLKNSACFVSCLPRKFKDCCQNMEG